MLFLFTDHAKYRIEERGISIDRIKQTIKMPERQLIENHGMIVVKKKFGKKTLEVVYKIAKNKFIIITAYYEN